MNSSRGRVMGHRSWVAGRLLSATVLLVLFAAGAAMAQSKTEGAIGKLNLSPQQRNALRSQIRSSRESMEAARKDLQDARGDLFKQLRQYRIDDRRLLSDAARINNLQRRLLQISLQNQIGLRKHLSRDQFAQLGEAIARSGDHDRDRDHEHGSWSPNSGDLEKLRLSRDQENQIKRLFDRSTSQTQVIASKLRTEMGNLRKLYMSYDLDQRKANAQIEKIAATEQSLHHEMRERQMQLRRILNEDQFNMLAKTMQPPHEKPRGQR